MNLFRIFSSLCPALLLAAPALAQAPGQPKPGSAAEAPVDAARLAAARELLKLMRFEQSLDDMYKLLAPATALSMIGMISTDASTKSMLDQLEVRQSGIRTRLTQLFAEEFLAGLRRRYPEMLEQIAQDYARTLTEKEMRDAIAFYATPSGARMLELQPVLQAKGKEAGERIGRAAGEEAARAGFERLEHELTGQTDRPAT